MRSTRNVVEPEPEGTREKGHYSDPPLLVLASLASGPKHGHAMIEDIQRLCGTRLGPGTLYGAIARLEQQGGSSRSRPKTAASPIASPAKASAFFAPG
jgi:hypothetical protein